MPDKVASQLPYPSSWLSPSEFAPFVSRERGGDHEHIPATLPCPKIQWDWDPGVAQATWGQGRCPRGDRGDGQVVEKWEPGQERAGGGGSLALWAWWQWLREQLGPAGEHRVLVGVGHSSL